MATRLSKRIGLFLLRNPWILFVFGFIIRIAFLPLDYSFDVNSHMEWGKEAVLYGLNGFYERKTMVRFGSVYPNYPPFAIYIFAIGYHISHIVYSAAWYLNTHVPAFPSGVMKYFDSHLVYAIILKIPATLADLGIAYIAYKTVNRMYKSKNAAAALIAACMVLFNPVFLYNSALWGQIDAIPLFFVMAALYTAYSGGQRGLAASGICFSLALLSKQSAIIFLPLYLIVVIRRSTFADAARTVFAALVVFWIMFLPFSKGSLMVYAFPTYISKMVLVSGLPFASNHAFNTWAVVTGWKDVKDTTVFLGVSYSMFGYIVASLLLLLPYMKLISLKTLTERHAYTIAFLTAFTVYLFFTRIHERHLLMAVALLIPAAAMIPRETYLFMALSVLHALNLYHNWSVPRIEPFVQILVSQRISVTLSAITLMVFCFYYPRLMRDFLRES